MSRYVKPLVFLDDQLPLKLRTLIPTTLKQAYRAADELISEQPILQIPSAASNHGRLKSWATDLAFERLISSGKWPYDCDWKDYEKPTGKYLRIRLESSLMSISLVADPTHPPRVVGFRANNALGNPYPFLFEEMNEDEPIQGLPSFVLVHGHKQPEFAHIGMPHPSSRTWIDKTPNLMSLPHEASVTSTELPPVEAEDVEAVLSLKDDLRKWQRDAKDE